VLEIDHRGRPRLGELRDPAIVDLADRHGVQVVVLLTSDLAPRHEVRGFEDGQMLHDAEPRQLGDRGAQLAQRESVLLDETIEETASSGLGERPKDTVAGVIHVPSKGDSAVTCQGDQRPSGEPIGLESRGAVAP
jgi:hypothetical protein